MAQKNINIGSRANKGDGDPISTALSKTQDNFTDLYSRLIVVESATGPGNPGGATIQQSIIGDVIVLDSTLIIDSIDAKLFFSMKIIPNVFRQDIYLYVD